MKSFILAGILSLMTLFPNVNDSTLNDIAKPYLGEYECKIAQIGSKDCLEQFSYILLELKDEENFILHYKEKDGKKKQQQGKYIYDKEKSVVRFTDKRELLKREFALKDGVLIISMPIGEKNLFLQFEQK